MSRRLARVLHRLERAIEGVRRRKTPNTPVLEPHFGYATPNGWVVRGRVLTRVRTAGAGRSRIGNTVAMLRLFLTDEVHGIRVETPDGAHSALSDEEGYVSLLLPETPGVIGWAEVPVRVAGRMTELPVRVPGPGARRVVISDIDDTMIRTGAWSLWRNLWTTLTGSVSTRLVFPDAVALVERLCEGGRNPVFYVSSSPWNLHGFLDAVFARAGVERGPMFLRDWGIDDDKVVTTRHGVHKGAAIDTILAANPDLPAVLVGDTGQHDAMIYADAAARHPGRIEAVILRDTARPRVGTDAALAQLREAGIPVFRGADHAPALAAFAAPR